MKRKEGKVINFDDLFNLHPSPEQTITKVSVKAAIAFVINNKI